MTKREIHRVTPHQEGGWQVKRDSDEKVSHLTSTLLLNKEVEQLARPINHNQGTELQMHGKDIQIQHSARQGNDPFSLKDKK